MLRHLMLCSMVLIFEAGYAQSAKERECSCELTDEAKQTLLEATSPGGREVKILIPTATLTTKKLPKATLCHEEGEAIHDITTWMHMPDPAKSHKGPRPSFDRVTSTCGELEKLRLFMAGKWEIKVHFRAESTGIDVAVVPVSVEKP